MVYVVVVNKQRYPTDLTDSQWDIIEAMVLKAKSGGQSRSLDILLAVMVTAAAVHDHMLDRAMQTATVFLPIYKLRTSRYIPYHFFNSVVTVAV